METVPGRHPLVSDREVTFGPFAPWAGRHLAAVRHNSSHSCFWLGWDPNFDPTKLQFSVTTFDSEMKEILDFWHIGANFRSQNLRVKQKSNGHLLK